MSLALENAAISFHRVLGLAKDVENRGLQWDIQKAVSDGYQAIIEQATLIVHQHYATGKTVKHAAKERCEYCSEKNLVGAWINPR